jgi:hypothetical protein
MSEACAGWQEWASHRNAASSDPDLDSVLDKLLSTRNDEAAA